jgi:hypothetical protein
MPAIIPPLQPTADTQHLTPNASIANPAAVDRLLRPALPSRNSESSTRTIRPRHIASKSQTTLPTLSSLNVTKAPKMSTNEGTSSGAADLLRQAMTQRYATQSPFNLQLHLFAYVYSRLARQLWRREQRRPVRSSTRHAEQHLCFFYTPLPHTR